MTKSQILRRFISFLKERGILKLFIDNRMRQYSTNEKNRRKIFLDYCKKRMAHDLLLDVNVPDLISIAFNWATTSQKDSFWRSYSNEWREICTKFKYEINKL